MATIHPATTNRDLAIGDSTLAGATLAVDVDSSITGRKPLSIIHTPTGASDGTLIVRPLGAPGSTSYPLILGLDQSAAEVFRWEASGEIAAPGIKIKDSGTSYYLRIISDSSTNFAADRNLTIDLNNAARTFSLQGNLTVESASLINQDLTSDANATLNRLTLSQSTGTAPMTISSTTAVSNLNADMADGQHLAASSSPSFTGITLSGLTTNRVVTTTTGGLLTTLSPTNSAILATTGAGVPTYLGALTHGQLIIGSTAATPIAATLTGTTNQVIVTNGAGSITLSTPQSIGTASSPTFGGLTLSGTTTSGSYSTASQDIARCTATRYSVVASITHTGTTDETAVKSWTVPANLLGTYRALKIEFVGAEITGSSAYTLRLKFGGTTFHTLNETVGGKKFLGQWSFVNMGAANSQGSLGHIIIGTETRVLDLFQGNVDTTLAKDITITCQLATSSDRIDFYNLLVILQQ